MANIDIGESTSMGISAVTLGAVGTSLAEEFLVEGRDVERPCGRPLTPGAIFELHSNLPSPIVAVLVNNVRAFFQNFRVFRPRRQLIYKGISGGTAEN